MVQATVRATSGDRSDTIYAYGAYYWVMNHPVRIGIPPPGTRGRLYTSSLDAVKSTIYVVVLLALDTDSTGKGGSKPE